MPWCPVCKNEYKVGYTHCNDCDVDLVESLEEGPKAVFFGEQEELSEMEKFLVSNQISDCFVRYDEKEKTYELFVPDELEIESKRLLNVYLREISSKEKDGENQQLDFEDLTEFDVEEDSENLKDSKEGMAEAEVYVDKNVKAQDYKSSAYTLLLVGIAGIILLVLLFMGVFPIQLNGTSRYLISGIMSLVFILFIVIGIFSMRSYKKLIISAEEENELIEAVQVFLKEQCKKDKIDQILYDEDIADEEKYFKRMDKMKELVKENFADINSALVEKLTDDWYSMEFEEKLENTSGEEV